MELQELNKIVEELSLLRERKSEINQTLDSVNEGIARLEAVLVDELTMNDLESFKSPYGTVYKVVHPSVKVADKTSFYQWLKDKDYFEGIVSVNSQTLKAFVKTQEGADIPGLEISDYIKLNFRKN